MAADYFVRDMDVFGMRFYDAGRLYPYVTFATVNNDSSDLLGHTWDRWHMIPSERPVFAPPKRKEYTLDIPGAQGKVDLSKAITVYPVFNNRSGSFTFHLPEFKLGKNEATWVEVYEDLSLALMSGIGSDTVKTCILDADPESSYVGQFSINSFKSSKYYSTIVIDYDVYPFKMKEAKFTVPNNTSKTVRIPIGVGPIQGLYATHAAGTNNAFLVQGNTTVRAGNSSLTTNLIDAVDHEQAVSDGYIEVVNTPMQGLSIFAHTGWL